MFDIGFSEMIILGVIALIAIGPKQLPEVARVVARFIAEFRRMTGDFTQTFMSARDSATQFMQDTQNQLDKSLTFNPNSTESDPVDPNALDNGDSSNEMSYGDVSHENLPYGDLTTQEGFAYHVDESIPGDQPAQLQMVLEEPHNSFETTDATDMTAANSEGPIASEKDPKSNGN